MEPAEPVETYAHVGAVIWLTGLSGAGKTTIAQGTVAALRQRGYATALVDGDILRNGLCRDLGFSKGDRDENVRRAGELATAFADAGLICVAALISPYRAGRDAIRARLGDRFHEVFVATPLIECERRDPKGLYQRVRRGEIAEYTGITSPYEAPIHPEVTIDTTARPVSESVGQLLAYVLAQVPPIG
jgi:adenylyl-sulfate kinase